MPVIVLGAIVTASSRALDSATLPPWPLLRSRSGLPTSQLCQMRRVRSAAKPSNLLVMGSSRTAAAMDVVWMNRSRTATDLRAERVVFTFGSELDRDLAFRTYVADRGVPEVLGIELSFTRAGGKRTDPLLATTRSHLMFEPKPYWDMVGSLRTRQNVSLADTYFWSRLQSTGGFALGRIDGGLDLALRDPPAAIRPRAQCARKKIGFFDNIGLAHPSDTLKTLDARRSRIWSGLVNSQGGVRFDTAGNELKLLRDLVDTAHHDGVKTVFLYYLPGFDEGANAIDLSQVQRRFPDTRIFDARTVLNDPTKPLLRQQFASASHVNPVGAYEVSKAFLEEVEQSKP
ncbi:MAG: hypothetical protein ABJC79_11835 [Acidimicrobiia bacterium]